MTHGDHPTWRDRYLRPRRVGALVLALLLVFGGIGYVLYAGTPGDGTDAERWSRSVAEATPQQVLGGERRPGFPSVQRVEHDGLVFTVTVAPALPGRNLVRVDTLPREGHEHEADDEELTVEVDGGAEPVEPTKRPGADGLWAVVDLPAGNPTVLVAHGPEHRIPVMLETGSSETADRLWAGPDGPECLQAATAAVLAGGKAPNSCPAGSLRSSDRPGLTSIVTTLASRGVEEIALSADASPRSAAAAKLVRRLAVAEGVRVVSPSAAPGSRNALLVVAGWQPAAERLAAVSSLPVQKQALRSDGVWLAPWLLSPGVVDSTTGAVIPLDFDIRDPAAQRYSQTLAKYFPEQSPTGSAYVAWRGAREGADARGESAFYAASRAAYMPAEPGHGSHETTVSWFPGGTVTRISLPTG
ncbi:hypothetical protein J2S40_000913 [Nocardioides luteus]|uniref:ABC transporter substrate-binding protein n=1 Tax=Nocardioides luteus TaxID=1844 RepID=A0ABQ5SSW5_9ACTN|nr:hypothetical protein [Nocardioides luteus]MDR7309855.1 hypothetical protein [Nocardioides luteus]GGR73118.1 hypothetical protein GCM10010197_45560 [Nocardioides luteus]GLJ67237.1 hypothetical protein GCM10017579_12730 [Nocardioides luteus]